MDLVVSICMFVNVLQCELFDLCTRFWHEIDFDVHMLLFI